MDGEWSPTRYCIVALGHPLENSHSEHLLTHDTADILWHFRGIRKDRENFDVGGNIW